jgi:DNA-binding transcriptional MerR regulator
MFDAQVAHHITFIQKAKTVGLTLKEMRRLLELARKGMNPCPEVVKWADNRAAAVERQIGELKTLHQRLSDFRQICSTSSVLTCFRPGEMCCLIEDLPDPKNGGSHAKAVRARNRAAGNSRG